MKEDVIGLKGKLIYFSAASLLGLLSQFESSFIYTYMILFAVLFLLILTGRKLSFNQLLLFVFCFLVYSSVGNVEIRSMISHFSGNEKEFIIEIEELNFNGEILTIVGEEERRKEKIILKYRAKSEKEKIFLKNNFLPGTICKANGTLKLPTSQRNPNSFDYQKYLEKKKIYWIVLLDKIEKLKVQKSFDPMTSIKRWRQKRILDIENSYPERSGSLTIALLFGERNGVETKSIRDFQTIGVIHLLSISGLHVGLFAGMVFLIFIRMGMVRETADRLLLFILPLYAVMTGLAPPVLRAVIMLMVMIGGRRLNRRFEPVDAISTAQLVILFFNPNSIYDLGFQLSFVVSYSLVLSSKKIILAYESYLSKTAAVTVIAQLSSLPIVLSSFYETSFVSILTNLLFIPFFSFALLPLVYLHYFLFLMLNAMPKTLSICLEACIQILYAVAHYFAHFPFAKFTIGKPSVYVLFLLISSIILFFKAWETSMLVINTKRWMLFIIPAVPIIIQIIIQSYSPVGEVTFIDVGQGDSILIELPYHHGVYLIDTGGAMEFSGDPWRKRDEVYDPGRKVVVPLLKSKGIRSIDKLILSHGDMDHIGGAIAILEEIKVKQVMLPKMAEPSLIEENVIQKAAEKNTEISYSSVGDSWKTPEGYFQVLWPERGENEGDKNDHSIVLYAVFGGLKWLFTGDLGIQGEKALQSRYGDLQVDVLKVGHHGSKNSSSNEFIETLRGKYAIMSVGEDNRYGHPHEEVLGKLMQANMRILRTDKKGAIIYKFKGENGTFTTQIP